MPKRRASCVENDDGTVPVPVFSGIYVPFGGRKKGDRHRARLLVILGNLAISARSQSPFLRRPFQFEILNSHALRGEATPNALRQ